MADIARIKGNISKMIAQNAPEADIDAYVASEGVTPDQLRGQTTAAPAPAPVQAETDPYRATARKEIDELRAKGVPIGGGSLPRRMIQSATFNTADEILAGALTPLEMIKRGTLNPAEAYRHAKAREDLLLEDARKDTGLGGTIAEIGGGVLTGSALTNAGLTLARTLAPNAGLLARSGAAAGDAAGMGILSGAMEGNSLSERGGNALTGGLLGGAIGGATPGLLAGAGAALSPVVSNIRARINPTAYGESQVARGISESGRPVQQIIDDVTTAAAEGQPMFTLADAMGNAGQRMLSTVTRAPGPGRTQAVEFLEGRQAGQGRRVAGSLAEGFDSPQTAAQTRTAMTEARDTAADAAYGAARQNAAPVDLSRVIARIDDTLQPGVNQIARPQSGIANDSVEGALDSFRRRLTDGQSVLTDFTAVQRVRGDLSDAIAAAVRAGQGNRARLLGGVLHEMDAAMESASSGFRAANRNFAQASTNIGAIEEGATAARRGRTEDIIPRFNALAPEGQSGFRSGYVDPLIADAQGAAFGANKARPLINDAFADESRAMAPGADLMQRRLGREQAMFETRNQATGGSRTADNLNDSAAMGALPGIVSQVMTGNIRGAALTMLMSGSNLLSGNTPAVREAVGNFLLQRGQNVSPANLQRIVDEALARIEQANATARLLGRAGAGGLAVAPAATSELRR